MSEIVKEKHKVKNIEEQRFYQKRNLRLGISVAINLVVALVAAIVIFNLGKSAFEFGAAVFDEKAVDQRKAGHQVELTLKENELDASSVSSLLYSKGLVNDKNVCYWQIKLSDYDKNFVAGTYNLSTELRPTEMFEIMTAKPENTEDNAEGQADAPQTETAAQADNAAQSETAAAAN